MSNDETVKTAPTVEPINERDLAPVPVADKARATAEDLDVVKAADPSNKLHVPSYKTGKSEHLTVGKRAHWFLTYIGGDWLLNSALGVSFAYLTSRTALGKKLYVEPINKGLGFVLSSFIKNEKTLEKVIGGGRDFFSIMFGGTMVNPILTYLEGHKQKKAISKSIDTLVYGKERVENDPDFKQAYDEIDHEPKKDNKSVWIARGFAVAPLWAATFFPKGIEFIKSNKIPVLKWVTGDNISNFTKSLSEKIGIKPKKMMETFEKNQTTGQKISNWQALHDLIGFDYGLTIYYAILHAFAFSAVAKHRHQNREDKKTVATTNHALKEAEPKEAVTVENELASPSHGHTPHAKVSNVAARETLKPAEQREMVQV